MQLSKNYIVDLSGSTANPNEGVYVYPETINPAKPLFSCTGTMLTVCQNGSDLQLDPSGHYVLLTEVSGDRIAVARIDAAGKRLVATGATPVGSYGYFNWDGTFFYTVDRNQARAYVYRFNPQMGTVTAGPSLSIPLGAAVTPAERR